MPLKASIYCEVKSVAISSTYRFAHEDVFSQYVEMNSI